jgi:hypothetical protein
MVTVVPTTPFVGEIDVTAGLGWSVKLTPLLCTPPAVTATLPLVAPIGGYVLICVEVHEDGFAAVPLNVTVPGELPKAVPLIWIGVATVPELGERLVMFGMTVKL